jgi:hypothetical protein
LSRGELPLSLHIPGWRKGGNSRTDQAPTAYPAVNATLQEVVVSVRAILGQHLRGIYLVSSLAVGDFGLATSELDLIVVTDGARGGPCGGPYRGAA